MGSSVSIHVIQGIELDKDSILAVNERTLPGQKSNCMHTPPAGSKFCSECGASTEVYTYTYTVFTEAAEKWLGRSQEDCVDELFNAGLVLDDEDTRFLMVNSQATGEVRFFMGTKVTQLDSYGEGQGCFEVPEFDEAQMRTYLEARGIVAKKFGLHIAQAVN
jgi:hypothetical protein